MVKEILEKDKKNEKKLKTIEKKIQKLSNAKTNLAELDFSKMKNREKRIGLIERQKEQRKKMKKLKKMKDKQFRIINGDDSLPRQEQITLEKKKQIDDTEVNLDDEEVI